MSRQHYCLLPTLFCTACPLDPLMPFRPTALQIGSHRVVCSRVRKKPSGALAWKEPEMRLSRQAAAPTLAQ